MYGCVSIEHIRKTFMCLKVCEYMKWDNPTYLRVLRNVSVTGNKPMWRALKVIKKHSVTNL